MRSKSAVKSKKDNCKVTSRFGVIFAVLAVIAAVFAAVEGCYIKTHYIATFEEEQRLAVFENLASSYIGEAEFSSDPNTIAVYKGSGLSRDNEVYLDFMLMTYNDNHEVVQTREGRLHFQWDTEAKTYAHAFSYEEPVEVNP